LVGDLFPCGEPGAGCVAGYAGPCNGACDAPPCDRHIYESLEGVDRAEARAEEDAEADLQPSAPQRVVVAAVLGEWMTGEGEPG